MQCVPSLFLSLSLSESVSLSLSLSLSICCCGIWEDFKHGEVETERQSGRERNGEKERALIDRNKRQKESEGKRWSEIYYGDREMEMAWRKRESWMV